jgi:sodium transport system permease protein
MRLRILLTILRKELTEALRDRVTLIVLIGLPVLIYPLVIFTAMQMTKRQAAEEDRRVFNVAVWGAGADGLVDWLNPSTNRLRLERWLGMPDSLRAEMESGQLQPPHQTNRPPSRPALQLGGRSLEANPEPENELLKAARQVVTSRQADAVLVALPGFDAAVQGHDCGRVAVYYDSVTPRSSQAWSRLSNLLSSYRGELRRERVQQRSLPAGFVQALEVRGDDVAPIQRRVSDVLGRALPVMLILLAVVGGMVAAVDMTAGEKDRATMQTLLCAPVRPLEIVGGKFLAIWIISLLSAIANLVGVGLTIGRVAAALHVGGIHLGALVGALGLLLPATWTIAALFLAVAVLARDAKDAGNFLGALTFAVMLLVSVALLPGVELDAWTCCVPLVNLSLLIRALLTTQVAAPLIVVTLLTSLAYAGLTLGLAARVFGREQNLLGGPVSWRSILRDSGARSPIATPGSVLLVFAIAVAAMFYLGLWVAPHGLMVALLATQFGALLLPAVGLTWLRKFPVAETFSLRRPHWRSVAGSVLIGSSASIALAGLVLRWTPPPESMLREMQELLRLGDNSISLWKLLPLIALTPALCEEALFRGLILSGLRRWGPWAAIGLTALGFGLLHGSIYRLLPTFLLGVILGYTVWRSRSLYCSMLIHALNNGLVAVVVWSSQGRDVDVQDVPWSWTLLALAATAVGLALLTKPKPDATAAS